MDSPARLPRSEFVEAQIDNCVSRLSPEDRDPGKTALTHSWSLAGLLVEERNGRYKYLASWKYVHHSETWIATVYVAIEIARAISKENQGQPAEKSYA